jgi:hypothetical protein
LPEDQVEGFNPTKPAAAFAKVKLSPSARKPRITQAVIGPMPGTDYSSSSSP